LPIKIRSAADAATSAVKKVLYMKLYKYLTLIVLLGMASAAYATPIDPTIILRGDGGSQPVGPAFAGGFQTTAADPFRCTSEGDGSNTNCFQNDSAFTFSAIHLFFHNPLLSYSCDNSQDPFFLSCNVSDNEVTFSGIGFDQTGLCGGGDQGPCQGITFFDHFLVGLLNPDGTPDTTDVTTYAATADPLVGSTPEPASVLLFVIAMGAIALFLKRA
jgi:hypothetical protein